MSGFRITERSMASRSLANLQLSMARTDRIQNELSSGKLVTKASDSPGDAVVAMQYRSDMTTLAQYSRNADDGNGWLDMAGSAVNSSITQVTRARELVLAGLSSGAAGGPAARESIALELDSIRSSMLGLANTEYLGRPIFGGTTAGIAAYVADDDGVVTFVGDDGAVERTVGSNAKVRVDTDGRAIFGKDDDPDQIFNLLAKAADDLRNHPEDLQDDLAKLDTASSRLQGGLSSVGSRSNQLSQMQEAAGARIFDLTAQLSDIEDIDLPKTITELSMQQTTYQAALAATAKVIQPSLVDFLR